MAERGGAAANDAGEAAATTATCDGRRAANNGGGDVQRGLVSRYDNDLREDHLFSVL